MNKVTLIIAFYNCIEYLELVFAGLQRQTCPHFEIIVADDGSSPETVSQVKKLIDFSPLEVSHIWQEDRGFRKNRILNQAIKQAATDYLIFIDMDCIPHREFIREHVVNSRENICLTGRRVNLSHKISKKLTPERIKAGYLEYHWPALVMDGIWGGSKDVEKGIYISSPILRRFFNRKKRGLLGCNFSIHKKDLLEINGFDERYELPSIGEDSDVQFRLELKGIGIKTLNQMAVQYHLYHASLPRHPENLVLFEKVQMEKAAVTPFGIARVVPEKKSRKK